MSPWTLLGWLLLGLVFVLIGGGVYLVGPWLNWPAWLPGVLILMCLVPPVAALIFKILAKFPPNRQKQAATTRPNMLQEPWARLIADLKPGRWPCFLLLGANEKAKFDLLQQAQDEIENLNHTQKAGELSLAVIGGAVWLNVPFALANNESKTGADSLAAPSLWADLVDLLAGFPGWLVGVVLLADLEDLSSPGQTGQINWGRPLAVLTGKVKNSLALWILGFNLEALAGGDWLLQNISKHQSQNPDLNLGSAPFGGLADQEHEPINVLLDQALARQTGHLNNLLENCDRGLMPNLGPGAWLLTGALDNLRGAWLKLVESLSAKKISRKLKFKGLFCGTLKPMDGVGYFFLPHLLWDVIQDKKFILNRPKAKILFKFVLAALIIFMLANFSILGFGAWQSRRILNQGSVVAELLSNAWEYDADLPLWQLKAAAEKIEAMEKDYWGPARLYQAPAREIEDLKLYLQQQLISVIPKNEAPESRVSFEDQTDQWLAGLWLLANEKKKISFKDSYGHLAAEIEGAATSEGRAEVSAALAAWIKLLPRAEAEILKEIGADYDQRVFAAWKSAGNEVLSGLNNRARLAGNQPVTAVSDLANYPGFVFLDKAGEELSFAANQADAPGWVGAILSFRIVRAWSDISDNDLFLKDKLAATGLILQSVGHNRAKSGWREWYQARHLWRNYETVLKKLARENSRPKNLLDLAGDIYSGQASPERTSLAEAMDKWRKSEQSLLALEPLLAAPDSEFIVDLLSAPLDLLHDESISYAAQYLQAAWNRDILLAIETLNDEELDNALFGEYSLVDSFTRETAGPFLTVREQKFRPAVALGRAFPFSPGFMRFINEGPYKPIMRQSQYPLTIEILPVTANKSAVQPRGVDLRLNCGDSLIQAESYNYQKSLSFLWQPQVCGEVRLTVYFDDFNVTKVYAGPMAFAKFAFEAGPDGLQWGPREFPDQRAQLEAAGVERLKLRFNFYGVEPIIDLLNNPNIAIPKIIIEEGQQAR